MSNEVPARGVSVLNVLLVVIGIPVLLWGAGEVLEHVVRRSGGRAMESAARAMLRDLESAIKAYEADYRQYPPSNPANDEADNRALVACLSSLGPRGVCYYVFRPEMLRGPLPTGAGYHGLGSIPGGYAAFPEVFSPLGAADDAQGKDRLVHNFFYRQPPAAFAPDSGFELWTGGYAPSDAPVTPPPATRPAGAPALPADPTEIERLGGVGAGRYFTPIHNW